ncbi:MAG: hypothetical protein JSW73_00435 [Candidatus Woesearchaeota archaeon]|nr:MAG: hypothetical protein JSW73_00435 [Candidatus Woesearchaeota archaeon]
MSLTFAIIIMIFSLIILIVSSIFLVNASLKFSKAIGISAFVIGSVVLAMATSLPEFFDVLVSNLMNLANMGIGVIIGSCITNLCLILGLVSIIVTSEVKSKLEINSILLALMSLFAFLVFGADGFISRLEGAAMFILFLGYIFYLLKKSTARSKSNLMFKNLVLYYFIISVSIFALVIGAYLAVSSGEYIMLLAGIPIGVIGLTVLAISTSLPELSSSIVAAIKKGEELALGNLIGSNIFNILFVIGLVALIHPISFSFEMFEVSLFIAIGVTLFFFAYVTIRKKADKWLGVTLTSVYVVYLYYILLSIY